jgi:hypothetical protein
MRLFRKDEQTADAGVEFSAAAIGMSEGGDEK